MVQWLRRENLAAEIKERQRWVSRYWARFPAAKKFLADRYPDEWDDVRSCRFVHRVYESLAQPGRFKLTPRACWRVPYCLVCTKVRANQRVVEALNNFNRVTPAGSQMRGIHIVLSAPLTEDGQGWGAEAHRDVPKFAAVVRRVLEDIYGDGLGGIMSYHDFGERPFRKIHPHFDLTLAGRRLVGSTMENLRRVDLRRERPAIDDFMANRARTFRIDARRGDIDFSPLKEGREEVFGALKYQMRELFDLRKIEYSRPGRWVEWKDYKTQRRERYHVDEFVGGFETYRHRLGLYGAPTERVNLHRYFGFMAKGSLSKTQELVAGEEIPHGKGCPCSECEDWEQRFPEEILGATAAGLSVN